MKEADHLSRGAVLVVIGSVFLVTVLSIALVWWIGPPPQRIEGPELPPQISRVRQTLIARDREGARMRDRVRRDLERYEWVDRERGIVRIPIDRAMELRASGVHP
jgi:hypothetical protein